MRAVDRRIASRRRFMRRIQVAASPLFAHEAAAQALSRLPDPMVWAPRDLDKLITDPKQALDVFDFEPVMRNTVPPAHFGYMATGIDDEVTLRANRAGFQKFQLLPRRLVDVSKIDMRTNILGTTYDSPIMVCPTSSNKAFHPDGEIGASRRQPKLAIICRCCPPSRRPRSRMRSPHVTRRFGINYPTSKWEIAVALAQRAERAGSTTIVVTVDGLAFQNWETLARLRRLDTRPCADCHGPTLKDYVARKPNFDGLDSDWAQLQRDELHAGVNLRRLRDAVKTKIVLKGILAREDAETRRRHRHRCDHPVKPRRPQR